MYATLSLRMQTRIGPQLVMAGQMLRVSGGNLEELVRQEINENPALELVELENANLTPIDFRKSFQKNHLSAESWDGLDDRLAARQTVMEQLVSQAALAVGREDQEVALGLLYSLDGYGYLREPLDELATRLGLEQERLENVLAALQEMDPPGIGARDLRECLSIQCAQLHTEGVDCALPLRILEEAWEEFASLQWGSLPRKVGASRASVEAAIEFIARNLYPYPLRMLPDPLEAGGALLFPDLVIQQVEKTGRRCYRLFLPGEDRYTLRLSSGFEGAYRTDEGATSYLLPEEREWIRERAERARVFIATLEQRWSTLRRIGEFLIAFQAEFLEHGPRCLKPVTRAAVAERLGLHESTISRAISAKTVQLPDGRLRPLSDLFDASLPVKEAMHNILSAAGQPMSDREMAERLGLAGFTVARRTVAKYREQLQIPSLHNQGVKGRSL